MEPAQNLQKAPDHLSAAMKAWWADVLARHGVPDSHRLYLLEAACGAWDRMEEARQTLAREGITVGGRYGPRTHPAVGIERDSRAAFARILKQLDLDPPPPSLSRTLAPAPRAHDGNGRRRTAAA
jgi:P27 family predicted phage terminase small subunit